LKSLKIFLGSEQGLNDVPYKVWEILNINRWDSKKKKKKKIIIIIIIFSIFRE
jgi:hypothetical protein